MQVTATAGWSKKDPPGKAENVIDKELVTDLERYVEKTIEARIARGVDLEGRPFKPYKDPKKAGQKVDLNESGKLLSSFKATFRGREVSFTYTAPYARYVDELRPFLGLTTAEQPGLVKLIDKRIDDWLDQF